MGFGSHFGLVNGKRPGPMGSRGVRDLDTLQVPNDTIHEYLLVNHYATWDVSLQYAGWQ